MTEQTAPAQPGYTGPPPIVAARGELRSPVVSAP